MHTKLSFNVLLKITVTILCIDLTQLLLALSFEKQHYTRKENVIYAPSARHVQVKCLLLNITKDIINFTADISAALNIRQQLLASHLAHPKQTAFASGSVDKKKNIHKSKYRE